MPRQKNISTNLTKILPALPKHSTASTDMLKKFGFTKIKWNSDFPERTLAR